MSPEPSEPDDPHTVAVSVAAAIPGAGVPAGSVTVSDGSANICTASLSGGSRSCALSGTPARTTTLAEAYGGNANFLANSATRQHRVMLSDTEPPVVSVPADVTVEATSAAGAAASYTLATATDAVDGALTPA